MKLISRIPTPFIILLWICVFSSLLFPREGERRPVQSVARPENAPQGGNRPGGFLHVLLSLALPGSGEMLMGNKGMGKIFLGSDITLWLGFFGTKGYVNVLQNELETFAAVHAGVKTRDKDAQYWIDIGTSSNIYDYNAEKLLERDINATYPEDGNFFWQWDSEQHRQDYLNKRLNRLTWKRRTTLFATGLVLNRLVSGIDVIRLIRKNKTQKDMTRHSFLHFNYANDYRQGENVSLNFTWRF